MVVTPIRGTVNKRMGNSTENVYSSGYFNYFLYVLFLFYLLFILKDWMVAVGYFFFLKATKHLLFSFCTAVSIMPGTTERSVILMEWMLAPPAVIFTIAHLSHKKHGAHGKRVECLIPFWKVCFVWVFWNRLHNLPPPALFTRGKWVK